MDLLLFITYNGVVTVCGGYKTDSSNVDFGALDNCFELESSSAAWKELSPLPAATYFMGSSIIDGKWLISGGLSAAFNTKTAIYDLETKQFNLGPNLPSMKLGHCQVTINETMVFFSGGFMSQETFLLNWESDEWILLENLPLSLEWVACGLLNNPMYGPGKKK